MSASKVNKVLKLLDNAGIVRPSDFKEHGVPREYLSRLHRRGCRVSNVIRPYLEAVV